MFVLLSAFVLVLVCADVAESNNVEFVAARRVEALVAPDAAVESSAAAVDVDETLRALNKRLEASNSKMEALKSSTERRLDQRSVGSAVAGKHTSVLGRKRATVDQDEGACADGSTLDTDRDGHLDCFDQCPTDFRKTRPGVCGCGVSDSDSDLDGRADCVDRCPLDAAKSEPGLCGCGAVDTGCGCNVEPVRVGDCSHVTGVASAAEGATYDVFAPDGGVGARLVLPPGALALRAGEQLVLKLQPASAAAQTHSMALDISLIAPPATCSIAPRRSAWRPSRSSLCAASASASSTSRRTRSSASTHSSSTPTDWRARACRCWRACSSCVSRVRPRWRRLSNRSRPLNALVRDVVFVSTCA
jgi:hypothetical protein